MAFDRPTLQELVERLESGLVSGVSILGPVLRRSMTRVLSRVMSGSSHLMHGHISYMVKQIFVKTADRESLLAMAEEDGVPLNAAEFANGPITVTGTNGEVLPAGKIFTFGSLEYEVDGDVTISGGSAAANVTCLTAGAAGNIDAGETLTMSSPEPGIDSEATSGVIDGGTEEEELEDFRARYLEELRGESLGGSDDDYIQWAKEISGVTRVWVYRHENGLGTVVVRFVRDNDGDFALIIPSQTEVEMVQEKFAAERPTTAEVTAEAPTYIAQNPEISLPVGLDTAANREAIKDELTDLYVRSAEPGDGNGRGTVYLDQVRTTIGNVVKTFTLISPTADFVPSIGELAALGTPTWS